MSLALRQAIEIIKKGDKETGKQMLEGVVRKDPSNETAWLWMSAVVDTDEERRRCLERVLAINPNNEAAQRGLAGLGQPELGDWLPVTSQPKPPQPPPVPEASSTAQPQPPPRPAAPPQPVEMPEPETTKKCPYCVETIKAEAVVCRYCGRDLAGSQQEQPRPTKEAAQEVRQEQSPPKKKRSSRIPILLGLVLLACVACWAITQLTSIGPELPSQSAVAENTPTTAPTPTRAPTPTLANLRFDASRPDASFEELAKAVVGQHGALVGSMEIERLPSGRYSVYMDYWYADELDHMKMLAIAYDYQRFLYTHADWPVGFVHVIGEGGEVGERLCHIGAGMGYELGEKYDWANNGLDEWYFYLADVVTDYRDGGPDSSSDDHNDEKTYFASYSSLCK